MITVDTCETGMSELNFLNRRYPRETLHGYKN